jgi:8-oxo-dGTP pyrophosphatase MutT (NUDIX family)
VTAHTIGHAAAFDCRLIEAEWAFARDHAAAIEANWQRRIGATPEIWNGRVLLLHDGALASDGVFRGHCFATDFKSFLGWRDGGFPPTGVRNCFAMAALESGDGAFVLGEMAPHTAPAGQVYFPSGTPDMKDVVAGRLDLEASARRELVEETGLDPATLAFDNGFTLVENDIRLCCMKRVRADESAETLVARIHAFLARDPQPELARMHVVRSLADITPAMPAFVVTYLRHRLE